MKTKQGLSGIKRKVLILFPLCLVIVGAMLFLPAGSLKYLQGWLFMAALFAPVIFVLAYFLKYDPVLLQRRIKFREKEAEQKLIIKIATFAFFVGFLIPGFDYRHGWSSIPLFVSIIADIIVVLSYILIFFVFRENSYTSRVVIVEKEQKVITTGPYSVIRHPMYAGIITMYLAIPFALGSYWALVFFIPAIAMIIPRALNEEKVLLRDLKGYREYMKKVRYRLIPGVW